MNQRIPLCSADMTALLAVAEMQPATLRLIQQATGPHNLPPILHRLRKLSLVVREKYDGDHRVGKRPYLYQLTPDGLVVATALEEAASVFARLNKQSQRPRCAVRAIA